MADEIDAGQARGEVATDATGGGRPSETSPNRGEVNPSTFKDLGLSSQRVAEWRKLRDCGGEDAIDAAINDLLAKGREPTHSNVERAV